jgi:putative oxidoreductase
MATQAQVAREDARIIIFLTCVTGSIDGGCLVERLSHRSPRHIEVRVTDAIPTKAPTRSGSADWITARMESRLREWGLLPLRIAVGLVFLMHGGQKLFVFGLAGTSDIMAKLGIPLASLAAAIVIAAELLGGAAIVLGVFARWAGIILTIEMLVAIPVARLAGGFFAPYGFEFEFTLLGRLFASSRQSL